MKIARQVMIAAQLFMFIPADACERMIKKIAVQVKNGDVENLKELQYKTMKALARCRNPQLATLQAAFCILASGTTFPQLSSQLTVLKAACDQFLKIPGFSHKLVDYLSNLRQKKVANSCWRELALALELSLNKGESIEAFDKSYKGKSKNPLLFSLVTDQKWILWVHYRLYPPATNEKSEKVMSLKQYFIRERDLVRRLQRGRLMAPVKLKILTPRPLEKSWRQWFASENIAVEKWSPAENGIWQKSSRRLSHQS